MIALRLPLAAMVGALFTASVFWLLWSLVSGPIETGDMVDARRIEFTRMRQDSDVESRREDKVELEEPPPPPELPQMSFASSNVNNNVATLTPVVDARSALQGLSLSAGSDTDVIPLVRIPPEYPARALNRQQEGWVKVRFTITETGAVKDPIVVEAEPSNVFDESALRAIVRWRYNPKVENGVAVERVGVETILVFELAEE
jgi:protein TonB